MKKTLLAIIAVLSLQVMAQEDEIGKFRFPEYDDEGVMKSQIFGDHAVIQNDGKVKVSNFKIEVYEKGDTQMLVTAPECVYDRKNSSARSESAVRIKQDQMIVTGKDFSWDGKSEIFIIRQDARVTLKDIRRNMKTGDDQ